MKIDAADIIMIIGFILFMVMAVWYIFGKSPTFEQLIISLLLLNVGWTYSLNSRLERHLGEHKGYNKAKE